MRLIIKTEIYTCINGEKTGWSLCHDMPVIVSNKKFQVNESILGAKKLYMYMHQVEIDSIYTHFYQLPLVFAARPH